MPRCIGIGSDLKLAEADVAYECMPQLKGGDASIEITSPHHLDLYV